MIKGGKKTYFFIFWVFCKQLVPLSAEHWRHKRTLPSGVQTSTRSAPADGAMLCQAPAAIFFSFFAFSSTMIVSFVRTRRNRTGFPSDVAPGVSIKFCLSFIKKWLRCSGPQPGDEKWKSVEEVKIGQNETSAASNLPLKLNVMYVFFVFVRTHIDWVTGVFLTTIVILPTCK